MSKPKIFKIIINKNLVHIQIHFLKIELVHVKFTLYESVEMNEFLPITT